MSEEQQPIVRWDKPAFNRLKKAYKHIAEDSEANAEKVRDEILKATRELAKHPEKYPPDKYKKNNPAITMLLRCTVVE